MSLAPQGVQAWLWQHCTPTPTYHPPPSHICKHIHIYYTLTHIHTHHTNTHIPHTRKYTHKKHTHIHYTHTDTPHKDKTTKQAKTKCGDERDRRREI